MTDTDLSEFERDLFGSEDEAPAAPSPGRRRAARQVTPKKPDAKPHQSGATFVEEGEDLDHDESNLHAGVSINWLAEHFGMAKMTVKKRLAKVRPIGQSRNHPIYSLRQVAGLLVPPSEEDIKAWIQVMRPNDLPTMLQKDYWDAALKRQKWEENAKHLWRTSDVLDVLGETFQTIKSTMQLWVDTIERKTELSDEQRELIVKLTDALQDDLQKRLAKMKDERSTPSSVAQVEADEVTEPSDDL